MRWDMTDGVVGKLCQVPDASPFNYAGKPGRFIRSTVRNRVELWDMNRDKRLDVLYRFHKNPKTYKVMPINGSLYIPGPQSILVIKDCL